MPVSDGNEHTHIQNAYYIDQETPINTPLSHMRKQEVTIKSNDFSGVARTHQALSGSVMIHLKLKT